MEEEISKMKMLHYWLFLAAVICLQPGWEVQTARVLLLPFNHGSHVNFFTVIGSALKEAGHDVFIIVTKRYQDRVKEQHGIHLCPNLTSDVNIMDEYVVKRGITNPLQLVPIMVPILQQQVREIIADKSVMSQLTNIDLVIVDGTLNKYYFILPYKLSVPYISVSPLPDPWSVRVPALPSAEGLVPLLYLTEQSNILHRLASTASYFTMDVLMHIFVPYYMSTDGLMNDLVPEKPNIGLNDLYLGSEMFLIVADNICLDAHRVSAPHYRYVGGIAAKPAKPLPEDMNKFVTKAEHGIVLVAFGSEFKVIPEDMLQKMIPTIRKSKLHYILKHSGEIPDNMPSNVLVSSWLPQNDILGHPKTRVFVTHVGNNGQLEAVYHGVPMLFMPFFGDQEYNTVRGEARGYGKAINPHSFTKEEFKEKMNEVIDNKSYFDKIQKCSRIQKHLPSGQESVVFWVDHVLQFGGSHLKPYYFRMPLWKFLMFDVLFIFLVGFLMWVYCVKRCCTKFCCSKTKEHLKHTKMD